MIFIIYYIKINGVALRGYTGWSSARTHGRHSVTVWCG